MVADRLVWLLICLKVLFSKTEPGKKKNFIKIFTTSKNFCNIDNTHFTPLKDQKPLLCMINEK